MGSLLGKQAINFLLGLGVGFWFVTLLTLKETAKMYYKLEKHLKGSKSA